jgi:tetratricopeptide (TPR) repeat protein
MLTSPQVSRPSTGERQGLFAHPAAVPIAICGLVALVYIGTLGFGFVYDDRFQVLDNTWLAWRYLPRYFTHHVWAFAGIGGFYWRPLFLVWFLLQRVLFGLNPAGWHAATVALHVATTALVYVLARRLSGDRTLAAIAAAIFGLQPALIETVAWVSGSSDSLLAVFLIPAFLYYLRWRDSNARASLMASMAFYAAALMTKEPAVMLLGLIAGYAWIHSGAGLALRARAALKALLPYVPVTAVYGIIHALIAEQLTSNASPATPLAMALTAPKLLLFYLRLLVFPYPISPEYPLALVRSFRLTQVVLPALALIAIAAAVYLWSRRVARVSGPCSRLILFASLWLLLPLLPVLYIKTLMWQDFAHARYLYLPCMGFAILVATAIRQIRVARASDPGIRGKDPSRVQIVIAGAIALVLAIGTATQQVYWASNLLLFSRGVQVAPRNPVGLTSLGIEIAKRDNYPEAISLMQQALQQDPNFWHANFSLGYTYFLLGRYDEAERLIERAVRLNPTDANPDQFAYLGMAALRLGHTAKAEWAVRQAIARAPEVVRYRLALALILENEGRRPEAIAQYQEVLRLDPSNAEARQRLSAVPPADSTH